MDVRKKSQKQEKTVAKNLNGRVTPASGALWGAKGDVRTDIFLIECKTTDKSSYSLKASIWNKICDEAVADGLRLPLMIISVAGNEFAVIEAALLEDYPQLPFYHDSRKVEHKSFLITSDMSDWTLVQCCRQLWGLGSTDVYLAVLHLETFLDLVARGVF